MIRRITNILFFLMALVYLFGHLSYQKPNGGVGIQSVNVAGIELIKKWEGLKDGNPLTVNFDPYLCPAKIWTIGFGHAITHNGKPLTVKNDPHGEKAKMLYPDGLTRQEVEMLLATDMIKVHLYIEQVTLAPLEANQLSAITSFVYNVGELNFKHSTLLSKLNKGDYTGASHEFPKWRKAKGKILPGLVFRRIEEKKVFLTPVLVPGKISNS